MGFYLDKNGGYYEGDKSEHDDQEVTPRPSSLHEWDGAEWVLNPIKQAEDLKLALATLEREKTSMRAIREILIQILIYFAGLQNVSAEQLYAVNPAFKGLKDLDAQAAEIREQIRDLT